MSDELCSDVGVVAPEFVLKNKIHSTEFEALVDFLKQFRNWAASPVASTEML